MKSSIFGPPGLYCALYSKSECRALYSAHQVYIEHYIQHLPRSIFSTLFNIRMWSSIFSPLGLYSELYSKTECRGLYSALQVYIQRYIKKPNIQIYIRPSRSIFSAIVNIRMQSSIFDSPGLYSALYSRSECRALSIFGSLGPDSAIYSTLECRALYSALQVYFQRCIQHHSTFGPPGLYSALYSKP